MEKLIRNYLETGNEEVMEKICYELKPIVVSISNKFVNSLRDYEDIDVQQELLMEVPKIVDSYDFDSNAKFTTYAYRVFYNKVLKLIRTEKAQKRNPGVLAYLENKIGSSDLTYEEILCDNTDIEYQAMKKEKKEKNVSFLKSVLNDKEIVIYEDYLAGMTLSDIANKHKIDRVKTRNKINYTKSKLKKTKDKYIEIIK